MPEPTTANHAAEAGRLACAADSWADADTGWKASLGDAERIQRRQADLAAAQVQAILALVDQVAEVAAELQIIRRYLEPK
jgi:hypothetical protein